MQKLARLSHRAAAVTLVEMVVAVTLLTVVFTAIMPLFSNARQTWEVGSARTDMMQNARVLIDHVYSHLAAASRIVQVSDADELLGAIRFEGSDGETYCYTVNDDHYVEFGEVGDTSVLAGPVQQFQLTCYDSNDFDTATSDVTDIGLVKVQALVEDSQGELQTQPFETSVFLHTLTLPSINPGVALRDYAGFSGWGATIDSYKSSKGNYDPSHPGHEAIVSVNDTGWNKIQIWNSATLLGDAYIGPDGDAGHAISTWSGGSISGYQGNLDEEIDFPDIDAPTYWPFNRYPESSPNWWWSPTLNYDSDHYFSSFSIWFSTKVVIEGDVTFVVNGNFEMGNDTTLEIRPDSSLTLYVKSDLKLWNNAQMNAVLKDPSKLKIYLVGYNDQVYMSSSSVMYAVVQNRSGSFNIWNNSEFFGKIKAETLNGGGKIHVDLDAKF